VKEKKEKENKHQPAELKGILVQVARRNATQKEKEKKSTKSR
jgi:hypothetical protein